jgi:ankyrin repeat protein
LIVWILLLIPSAVALSLGKRLIWIHALEKRCSRAAVKPATLHEALTRDDIDHVRSIIAAQKDLNGKNENGETPLHLARSREVTELLLSKGADVNVKDRNGNTPLHNAAGSDDWDIAELLIAKGANVNAKNGSDVTPLHLAALGGCQAVLELLLAHKADVNAKTKYGDTPLSYGGPFDYIAEMLRKQGARR